MTTYNNSSDPINRAFDPTDDTLKVKIDGAVVEIDVTALTDSIKIGDGAGETATITDVGGKKSLDVNVTNITLDSANDSVSVPGVSTSAKQDEAIDILELLRDDSNDSLAELEGHTTQLTALIAKDFATTAKQDTSNTKLDTLIAKDFSTSALQTTGNTKLDTLIAKDFATTAKQDTGNTSLATIAGKDFATQTTLALMKAKTDNLDVASSTLAKSSEMTTLNSKDFATQVTLLAGNVLKGAVNETAPVSDTASSGLNGRLQRIAQNITSLLARLPAALGSTTASASLGVTASTEDIARQGIITETAPASDTASSGQNGRLQRLAQRLTTLIAVFPTTIDTNSGNKSASTLRMVLATDQPTVPTAEQLTASATNSWTRVPSTAAETGHILKGSAGRLYKVMGYNGKSTSQFIQIHNTTTVPSDTAVPIHSYPAPPLSHFNFDFGSIGDYYATGISICNSSTQATKTVGSADCWFVGYVV